MTSNLFDHDDILGALNENVPLNVKLTSIHRVLRGRFGFIERVAIALYDQDTDVLKTFVSSDKEGSPLRYYESPLSEANSLREILTKRRPRVVQDLTLFGGGEKVHTQKLAAAGFAASYTMPMFQNGELFGFLFFNSMQRDCFTHDVLHQLDLFGHLISLTIINELTSIRMLVASVQVARHVSQYRDVETGAHVNRTAHYARLIARELGPKYNLSDDFIENVFLFSPLHDIGKVGIPDRILKKPGALSESEFDVMKTHARLGREIIDALLEDFGTGGVTHADVLRNIAEFHHEAVDGSGYPSGLSGSAIPLEARISSVADVFDALTSKRPYKDAWTNEEAIKTLQRLSGTKLDKECVEALVKNMKEVQDIQRRFVDSEFG